MVRQLRRNPDYRPGRRVWAALERYEIRRDWATHEVRQVLPEELGVVHALADSNTGARDPEFFAVEGPYAICGRHVKVRLAVDFSSDDDDACPRCVELVAAGHTFPPNRGTPRWDCQAVVHPEMAGRPQVVDCALRDDHEPPHRSRAGDTWVSGPEDFTPSSYTP